MEIPTQEEVDAELDRRTLEILRQQAVNVNEFATRENLPLLMIDLDRIKTKLDLAVSLWQRGIKTLPVFGKPYDYTFAEFVRGSHIETTTDSQDNEIERSYPLEKNPLLIMLDNPEIIVGLLGNGLDLPSSRGLTSYNNDQKEKTKYLNNVKMINNIVILLNKGYRTIELYWQFRQLLKKLSNIDLAFIAIECDNSDLFNNRHSLSTIILEIFDEIKE